MTLYKFLDLPKIPKELLDKYQPETILKEVPSRAQNKNGQELQTSGGIFYYLNEELDLWLRANITPDFFESSIRYTIGGPDRPVGGIHTDKYRVYALMYNIVTGGAGLSFWQEPGQSLIRSDYLLPNDYDQLTLVESIETPKESWYIFDTRALHSIENLTGTRINIQLSLNQLPNDIQL